MFQFSWKIIINYRLAEATNGAVDPEVNLAEAIDELQTQNHEMSRRHMEELVAVPFL